MSTSNPHKIIVEDTLTVFLDCFGGGDGGVSFVKFKAGMEQLAENANKGDPAAESIIERVARVGSLISYFSELEFEG